MPSRDRAPLVRDVRDDVFGLLKSSGTLAGHYCVLGPDPWRVLFTTQRSAMICFLDDGGAVLCWRGPVGASPDLDEALNLLADYAQRRRRGLFILECDEATANWAAANRFRSRWVGTETSIDLARWSVDGKKRRKLRWAKNHARSLGVTWRELHGNNRTDETFLSTVEEAWKAERADRRTDSFLRSDYRDLIELRRYFGAFDAETCVATVTCTPLNARSWYLQDLVRRPTAPRGALEGAIVLALDTLRDEGFLEVSNGPLPMSSKHGFEKPRGFLAGPLFSLFDRHFHFESINRFRSKLEPDATQDLFVVYAPRSLRPRSIWSLLHLLRTRLAFPDDDMSSPSP